MIEESRPGRLSSIQRPRIPNHLRDVFGLVCTLLLAFCIAYAAYLDGQRVEIQAEIDKIKLEDVEKSKAMSKIYNTIDKIDVALTVDEFVRSRRDLELLFLELIGELEAAESDFRGKSDDHQFSRVIDSVYMREKLREIDNSSMFLRWRSELLANLRSSSWKPGIAEGYELSLKYNNLPKMTDQLNYLQNLVKALTVFSLIITFLLALVQFPKALEIFRFFSSKKAQK